MEVFLMEMKMILDAVVPTYLLDEQLPYPNQEPCFAVLIPEKIKYKERIWVKDCFYMPFTMECRLKVLVSMGASGKKWLTIPMELMRTVSCHFCSADVSGIETSADLNNRCFTTTAHFSLAGYERIEEEEETA